MIKENIKRKVDLSNFAEAKTDLENTISDHQDSFGYTYSNKKEKYGEKILLDHALNHLNATIDKNDPTFKDYDSNLNEIGTKSQSDIVKDVLLRVPKSDYSST